MPDKVRAQHRAQPEAPRKKAASGFSNPLQTTVRTRGQITLPAALRSAWALKPGDALQVEVTAEGILLRPQQPPDASQAWFWTQAWLAGELQAQHDIEMNRLQTFDSAAALLEALEG